MLYTGLTSQGECASRQNNKGLMHQRCHWRCCPSDVTVPRTRAANAAANLVLLLHLGKTLNKKPSWQKEVRQLTKTPSGGTECRHHHWHNNHLFISRRLSAPKRAVAGAVQWYQSARVHSISVTGLSLCCVKLSQCQSSRDDAMHIIKISPTISIKMALNQLYSCKEVSVVPRPSLINIYRGDIIIYLSYMPVRKDMRVFLAWLHEQTSCCLPFRVSFSCSHSNVPAFKGMITL